MKVSYRRTVGQSGNQKRMCIYSNCSRRLLIFLGEKAGRLCTATKQTRAVPSQIRHLQQSISREECHANKTEAVAPCAQQASAAQMTSEDASFCLVFPLPRGTT